MKKSLSKNSSQAPVIGEMHFSTHKELDAAPYILNDEEIRRDWDLSSIILFQQKLLDICFI